MAFEYEPEGGEEVSHLDIWEKSVQVKPTASAKAFGPGRTSVFTEHGGSRESWSRECGAGASAGEDATGSGTCGSYFSEGGRICPHNQPPCGIIPRPTE